MTTDHEREDQASVWAVRMRDQKLGPSDQAELQRWLDADPRHLETLAAYLKESADWESSLLCLQSTGVRLARPEKIRPRWIGRMGLAAGAAALIVIILVFIWPAGVDTIHSAPGLQASHTLKDGSVVDLSGNTRLSVQLARGTRHVKMDSGEAVFHVAKDAQRPFLVQTANGTIRVTGTVFNVRAQPGDGDEVTVLEGRVEVTSSQDPGHVAELHPGDQTQLYGMAPTVRRLTTEELERATAWRKGVALFDAESLRSAVNRMAAYHGRRVDVSPKLDGLTVGGQYDLNDFDSFLAGLQQVLPIRVLPGTQGYVRIVPR